MAGVRDPAFWKRFSVAVHLDEEKGKEDLKVSDSWLARQHQKRMRNSWICWSFWMGLFILIAAAIAVVIWLIGYHVLDGPKASVNGATSTGT